jgi:large subunit ribosomal protein L9
VAVRIEQKAGMDGRLFGSVGNADIAEAICAAGVQVKRFEIRMPNGAYKAIGEYTVELALHHDVVVEVPVAVVHLSK